MIYLFVAGMLIVCGAIYTLHLNTVPDETVKMSLKAFKLYLETFPEQWEIDTFYPEYIMWDESRIAVRFCLFDHIRYCFFYWKVIREQRKERQRILARDFVVDLYARVQEGYHELREYDQASKDDTDNGDL